MSKGSHRRRENTALVEANWPWPDKDDDVREVPQEAGSDEGCGDEVAAVYNRGR